MSSDGSFEGFLQEDPRWNEEEAWPSDQFPDADYHYIGECGCLICALADLLRLSGIEPDADEECFNPVILNRRLIRCGAFFPTGNLDLFAVSRLYPLEYGGPVRYSGETLADLIGRGVYCLVTVPGDKGLFHFLAVAEIKGDDVVVMDPNTGKRYLSEYKQVYEIRPFHVTGNVRDSADEPEHLTVRSGGSRLSDSGSGNEAEQPQHFDFFGDKAEHAGRRAGGGSARIALTFDDGPSEVATNRILSTLEENGARATFFVVGERVEENADCLRRMVKDGCQIGNHTWDHHSLCHITEEERRLSLLKTSDAILYACGVTPSVMRSPGGEMRGAVLKTAEDLGLSCINWSVDPWDWQTRDARATTDYVLERAADGDIVLLHDLYDETADAVEVLVPELLRRGFTLVTLEELAADRGGLQKGKLYLYL